MEILDYFSGTPRTQQIKALKAVERCWGSSDVIVIRAPTATGKSKIAHCIAKWSGQGTTILVPNNMLVDQYLKDNKDLNGIGLAHSYGNKAAYARKKAKLRGSDCVLNYYSHLANKAYNKVAIIDEAHKLIPFLQGETKVWYHLMGMPEEVSSVEDFIAWTETEPIPPGTTSAAVDNKINKLKGIRDTLLTELDNILPEVGYAEYKGKPRKYLSLRHLTPKGSGWTIWPEYHTKKIVLMSATISESDIRDLGLDDRCVTFIEVDSPIPADRRPVVYRPQGSMGFSTRKESAGLLLDYINELAEQHKDRGIIHVTYSMSRLLQSLGIDNERIMFHTNVNKREVFDKWLACSDGILMACGMQEGIDLVEDRARWQVIAKINYPQMTNPVILKKMKLYPEWYQWVAVRSVLQAAGRVCRTPTDYGVTYITDKAFARLYKNNIDMFPEYFRDSIIGDIV